MPCHAYFEGEVLRIDFFSVVTTRDFAELAPTVEQLERSRPVVPHRISDLTRTSGLHIGFPAMFAFAKRRESLQFPNAFKSAIVAPQVVHVGLARMFQTLNQHPQISIEIFPDLLAATAWIFQP